MNKTILFSIALWFLYLTGGSQDINNQESYFKEIPIETKHKYTVWRTDYYICTGIAYAKSMGQSVEDFARFVGKYHNITSPGDTSLIEVAKTTHFVMTNYPGGEFQLVSESDSSVIIKTNRPYKSYFNNGPILGVTLEEFEGYLFGHVAVMTSKINISCDYKVQDEEVLFTFSFIN
jgi:hypothetical protein